MYDAIRSVGPKNFYFETLEKCDNKLLNERESYWIKQYNSCYNGYNSTLGGSAGCSAYEGFREEIVNLYLSGIGSETIARKLGCHGGTILNILKAEEIDIRKNSKEVRIPELDKSFESISEAARYVIDNGLSASTNARNVAQYMISMCRLGRPAYGLNIECDDIKQIDTECLYTTCKVCNKIISIRTKSKLCNSCSNVEAKGKTRKPSKDELAELFCGGTTIRDIAEKYNRTVPTVYYWLHQYNLM